VRQTQHQEQAHIPKGERGKGPNKKRRMDSRKKRGERSKERNSAEKMKPNLAFFKKKHDKERKKGSDLAHACYRSSNRKRKGCGLGTKAIYMKPTGKQL